MSKFNHNEQDIQKAKDIILDLELSFDTLDPAFNQCLQVWVLLDNELTKLKLKRLSEMENHNHENHD
jgi:hypothetical protein